jgi:hypothetical protein
MIGKAIFGENVKYSTCIIVTILVIAIAFKNILVHIFQSTRPSNIDVHFIELFSEALKNKKFNLQYLHSNHAKQIGLFQWKQIYDPFI